MMRKYAIVATAVVLIMFSLISVRDKEIVIRMPGPGDVASLEAADLQGPQEPEGEYVPPRQSAGKRKTSSYTKKRTFPTSPYGVDFEREDTYGKDRGPAEPLPSPSDQPDDTKSSPPSDSDSDTPSDSGEPALYALGGGSTYTPSGAGVGGGEVGGTGDGVGGGDDGGDGDPTPPTGPAPILTSITPSSGAPGSTIFIQGANFDPDPSENIVQFTSISEPVIAATAGSPVISSNQLQGDVPDGFPQGFADVNVGLLTTAKTSNTIMFNVLQATPGQIFEDESFARTPADLVVHGAHDVKLNDIDGDKDLDLVIVSGDGDGGLIQVLFNNDDGLFTKTPIVLGDLHAITDAILGDIDGDSDLDLLYTRAEDQSVALFINDGSGGFTTATSTNLPSISGQAQGLDLGDVNGDGYLDIIVANTDTADLLFLNDKTGKFTQDTNFTLPSAIDASTDIILGDVDKDGDLDIFTTTDGGQNRIYISDGSGGFSDETATRLPADSASSRDAEFADADGNGLMDIIVGNINQNALLINNGAAGFADQSETKLPANTFPSEDAEFGDIDGDGDLDIVLIGADESAIFINNGAGFFEDKSIKLPPYEGTNTIGGKDVELGDIDADGDLDMVVVGSPCLILVNKASTKAPVLDPIGNKYVAPNTLLAFNVTAADPNDDVLTYSAGNLPAGASFNTSNQLFSWTPTAADIGVYSNVHFEVTDGTYTDSEDIDITVATNVPPVLSVWPVQSELTFYNGTSGIFYASATDPDGDLPITIKWVINGQTIGMATDDFSMISVIFGTGDHEIAVTATDARGAATSFTWILHVIDKPPPQNRPPVIDEVDPPDQEVKITVNPGDIATQKFEVTRYHDPDGDNITTSWHKREAGGAYEEITELGGKTSGFIALTKGEYYIKITLTDDGTPNLTTSFEWHVIIEETQTQNRPPVIDEKDPADPEVNITVQPGDIATQKFEVTRYHDPDGDTIATSWHKREAGGAYEEITELRGKTSGFIALTKGEYYIKVTLTDDGSPNLATSFEWHVSVEEKAYGEFINDILASIFPYFWNETDNPSTGFVRDRLPVNPDNRNSNYDTHYEKASMAATGFGLTALCVAAERYGDGSDPAWTIPPKDLEDRAELIINKLLEIQSNQNPADPNTWETWGRDGFFYHFVDISTGQRWVGTQMWERSEVSTIDTSILVAGALTAGEYFGGTVREKALQLYRNVNWNAFLDTEATVQNEHIAANPSYNQMYHAWKPEDGFFGHWDYTSECLLLYLLASATPEANHAVPAETFYSFRRELGSYGADGLPMVQAWFGPLFVYQYTQAFFNFKDGGGQALYDMQGVNWWENSVEATKANKKFCNDNIGAYAGEENLWGLTSGYTSGFAYEQYGAPPAAVDIPSPEVNGADGTVMPAAAGGSIPMLPNETLAALNRMKELHDVYGHPVWGDYGFVDSFKMGSTLNDEPFPVSSFYVGIDMGAILVMAENYSSGLIWNKFADFQIEAGTKIKDRIIELVGLTAEDTCKIYVDGIDPTSGDIAPTSDFRMGVIDSDNTACRIQFDLTEVKNKPYLLAIHSFMDNFAGTHQVEVGIEVNGNNRGARQFNHIENEADTIAYIQIDNSDLQVGANTVTLTWQSGASWLAWENVEISTPFENDSWSMARDLTDQNNPVIFGSEYRVDDTYYVGADISSMEQAINKDVQNFTDIVFYTENTGYGTLTLDALKTDRNLPTNVEVFVNGSVNPVFNGRLSTDQTQETQGFYLEQGWNWITLFHPGTGNGADSEWIRWRALSFVGAEPPPPDGFEEFVGASFGKNRIKLRWDEIDGASKYNVYRSDTRGVPGTKMATVNAPLTAYSDSAGLDDMKRYYYVVKAVDNNGSEFQSSPEIGVTTGPYELDYSDGHDPNVFGGQTWNNSGALLGDNAYVKMAKWNGEEGFVRRIVLGPGEKNTIGLNNENISDTTIFSFRIRSENGGEKFQIKLKDGSGGENHVSMESPAADTWQELHFYVQGDFPYAQGSFPGVDFSNVAGLEVISEAASGPITIYLDEVEFNTVSLGTDRLDVKIRNGLDDSLASSLSFGTNPTGTRHVLADQYLEINYVCQDVWGIQIYTDNMADDAYPRFRGNPAAADFRANGLVGARNSGYRVPLIWQVWTKENLNDPHPKKGYYDGSETPEFDTTRNDKDRAEFAFVVDKGDSDWEDVGTSGWVRSYRTLVDRNGNLGAPVPMNNRPRQATLVGHPLYVYLGVDFTGAPAQTYTTNKLTLEIWHD